MTQQREDIPNLLQQVSHTSAEFIRRAGRAGRTRRARRDRRPLGLLAWVERHAALLLALLVLGYIIVISAAAIIKFQRYQMGFDLALIQQVIWNTLQGRPFETQAYDFTDNLLGTNSFFVLLIFAPLYAVWPNPASLLIGQTIVVGSSAVAVYLLGADILKQRRAALVVAAVYLAYLPVLNGNLYEIRERVLAMAFELWILLCIHRRRFWPMLLPMLLALACRLDTTIGVALLGCYALLLHWSPQRDALGLPQPERIGLRYGVTLIAAAVAWYLFVTSVMVPSFTDRPGYLFAEHYAHLGATPAQIVANVLLHPLATLQFVLTPERLWYLFGMFLPLAFLPLLNWRTLLVAAPLFVLNLLSNRPAQWDVYHHYQGQIVPLMMLGAIFGLALLERRRPFGRHSLPAGLVLMLAGTALSHALFGSQPISLLKRWRSTEREAALNALVAHVPDDAAVAVGNRIAPHLDPRRGLFLVPGDAFHYVAEPFRKAEYAIVDLDYAEERAAALAALESGGWCVVASTRDVQTVEQALAAQASEPETGTPLSADALLLRAQDGASGGACASNVRRMNSTLIR